MNSNNRNPMFPFRRGGKKRGKGQGGRRHPGAPGGGAGRRIPGSAAELLPLLQPATKSLAQVLAGNTRASGQIVHARNILAQAQRLIDERAADRLPPAVREEFLEQVARLKLTLIDAEEVEDEAAEAATSRPEVSAQAPISMARLREMALSIAGSAAPTPPAPNGSAAQPISPPMPVEAAPAEAAEVPAERPASRPERAQHGGTLRLKVAKTEPTPDGDPEPSAPTR